MTNQKENRCQHKVMERQWWFKILVTLLNEKKQYHKIQNINVAAALYFDSSIYSFAP